MSIDGTHRITVIVCGSAGALRLHEFLQLLRRHLRGEVEVMLTHSAAKFVHPETISWYVDNVYMASDNINPVGLASQTDLVVVYPSTVNIISAAALGLASSNALTMLLATSAQRIFFPHSSVSMWEAAVTRGHVATLRSRGDIVVDPEIAKTFLLWKRAVGDARPSPSPADVVRLIEIELKDRVALKPSGKVSSIALRNRKNEICVL